jgi:membrane protein implicated in regulation of membrane protease activity
MSPEWQAYLVANVAGWLLAGIVGWVAVSALDIPVWMAVTLAAGWIVKDLLLFPVMRRFYVSDPPERRIVGEKGVALGVLDPAGVVRVRGEIWQAQVESGADAIPDGSPVRVRDVRGMMLTVESDLPPT